MTIMTQTIAPLDTRRATPAETASRGNRREVGVDDHDDASFSSFGALLETLRGDGGSGAPRAQERMAGQIFEPAEGSAHEQRASSLEQADRAARLSGSDGARTDRTSIDARTNQTTSAGRFESPRGTGEYVPRTDIARESQGGAKGEGSQSTSAGDSVAQSMRSSAMARQSLAGGAESASADARGADRAGDLSRPGTGASATLHASSSVVAAAHRPVSTGGGAAQEVARALGVTRAGEVESVRGTAGTPTSGNAQGTDRGSRTESPIMRRTPTSARQPSQSGRSTASSEPSPFDRVVATLRLRLDSHRSSVRMQLDPPNLGRVSVDVRMTGDEVRIEIRTETEEARELLQGRADKLRTAMAQHGILIEQFEVTGDLAGSPGEEPTADQSASNLERQSHGGTSGGSSRSGVPVDDFAGNSGGVPQADEVTDMTVVAERRLDVKV